MDKNNSTTRQTRTNSQECCYRPSFQVKTQNPNFSKDRFRNKALSYNLKQGEINRVLSNQSSPCTTKYCFNVSNKPQSISFSHNTQRHSLGSPRKDTIDRQKLESSLPFLYGHLNNYNVKTHFIDLYLRVRDKTIRYRDYLSSYAAIALDLYKRDLIPLISLDYYTKQITSFVSPKIRKLDMEGELFWDELSQK